MSGFSSALKLTDLNDFIQPSQACIKPVQDANQGPKDPAAAEDEGLIRINRSTNWKRNATKDSGDPGVKRSETKTGTTPLNVTLGDCLACSGCITSAEAVLIAEQSHEKVFEILDAKNQSGPDSVPTLVVLSLSLQSLASLGAKSGLSIEQTARRLSHFFVQLGVDYVCDIALARHLCLVESAREFVFRHRQQKDQGTKSQVGPLLSSTCPGFVCYAEKSQGSVLVPLLSQVKSPQQIMGILVKKRLDLLVTRSSESLQSVKTDSPKVYHITLMPCYDKKLEASRLENRIDPSDSSGDPVPEVDCVITPIELEKMLEMRQVQSLADLPERPLDQIYPQFYELGSSTGQKICSHIGSGTGGYAENLFRHVASELYHWKPELSPKTSSLSWKAVRNADFLELNLYEDDGSTTTTGPSSGSADSLLSFAILNGFRNVQNLVSRLKRRACNYDYIEVSACPKGCLNGGAQLRPEGGTTAAEIFELVQQLYDQLPITDYDLRVSEEVEIQPEIQLDQLSLNQMSDIRHKTDQLYRDLGIDQQLRKQMHTKFAAIPKSFNILNSNW